MLTQFGFKVALMATYDGVYGFSQNPYHSSFTNQKYLAIIKLSNFYILVLLHYYVTFDFFIAIYNILRDVKNKIYVTESYTELQK